MMRGAPSSLKEESQLDPVAKEGRWRCLVFVKAKFAKSYDHRTSRPQRRRRRLRDERRISDKRARGPESSKNRPIELAFQIVGPGSSAANCRAVGNAE